MFVKKRNVCFVVLLIIISSLLYTISWTRDSSKRKKHVITEAKMKERAKRRYFTELEQFNQVSWMKELATPREPFRFTLAPSSVEKKDSMAMFNLEEEALSWSMVIMVKSHYQNLDRRRLARETWGSFHQIGPYEFRTIFIVGMPEDAESQEKLKKEHKEYGDLLQLDIPESYRNIVYKTLAGMQWVSGNVPSDWFYASADDDVIPDLPKVILEQGAIIDREIEEIVAKIRSKSLKSSKLPHVWKRLVKDRLETPIFCAFGYIIKTRPKRIEESKWYVGEGEYPLKRYPPYCYGGFYTMGQKLASKLYDLSRKLPLFWIDDVWVTGFLRLKYFTSGESQCEYCKVFNTTRGLWTEVPSDQYLMKTGNETILRKEWTQILQDIIEFEH